MRDLGDLFNRTEENRATFVKTDLDLAITVARIALSAPEDSDKRKREASIARRAYDTLTRFRPTVITEKYEQECIDGKMRELRELLLELEKH